MSAWLSPRVRLGAMVSVIALIVCAVLLTPGRSESVHQLPDALDPAVASTAPTAATSSATYTSKPIVLPQLVINSLGLTSPGSSSESSRTASPGTSQLASADPDTWAMLAAQDAYGELVLAERGIALTWAGCADCTAPHTPQIPFGPAYLRGGGGGSGGGAGSAGGVGSGGGAGFPLDVTPPNGLTEFGNPSLDAIRQGDAEGPIPHGKASGNPFGDVSRDRPSRDDNPVHPINPHVPPTVPVPEPSTVSLLAAAAFALTAWGRRARMHRD